MPLASDTTPPPTFSRALSNLAHGALWGASLVSLGVGAMLLSLQFSSPEPFASVLSLLLPLAFSMLAAFVIAFFLWLMGLLVIGAPGWWVLHRFGIRSRLAAAGLGAVLAPVSSAAWSVWIASPMIAPVQTLKDGLVLDTVLAAIGAVVGWVVIVRAYQPEPRP